MFELISRIMIIFYKQRFLGAVVYCLIPMFDKFINKHYFYELSSIFFNYKIKSWTFLIHNNHD